MTFDLSKFPVQLNPRTDMVLDAPIPLYEGHFQLIKDSTVVDIVGKIAFKWFPSHGVCFEGEGSTNENIYNHGIFNLQVNNQILGSCFLTNISNNATSFKGVFTGECIIGEKDIPVTSIEFEVCNLREFNGRGVQISQTALANTLILLEDEHHKIELFKHKDFQAKNKDLKWNGSFQSLYSGKLVSKKSSETLTQNRSKEVFDCLFLFLSFLNGRRCSPIFRKGIYEESEIWQDYTPYHVDKFKNVLTWPPQTGIDEIESLWSKFYTLYKNADEKDFLNVAIHTYIRANGHIALPFEGISMVANNLELLVNYLVVEKKKIIAGKDVESLQASNKIRLLLSQVGVKNEIPDTLTQTKIYQRSSNDSLKMDGPEFFMQIRNTIVHGQLDKRKKLSKIPLPVMWEVLNLSIWYVEVILLYVLKYKGTYRNRTLNSQWNGEAEESMPWTVIESD